MDHVLKIRVVMSVKKDLEIAGCKKYTNK